MNITKDSGIGSLVAENYRMASVFKAHQIDFCCNGGRKLGDVCDQKGISTDELIEELQNSIKNTDQSDIDFKSWPADLLADYIEKTHHRYVRAKISEIVPFLNKVVRVHGQNHPELFEMEKLFGESAQDMTSHMMKEEKVLFPYIQMMTNSIQFEEQLIAPHFGRVENPVAMMMEEHDTEGERFRRIAELSNNYTPPADACNTYRVTFSLLQEFENDLHRHIHLENNILFPKAVEMERQLDYA